MPVKTKPNKEKPFEAPALIVKVCGQEVMVRLQPLPKIPGESDRQRFWREMDRLSELKEFRMPMRDASGQVRMVTVEIQHPSV